MGLAGSFTRTPGAWRQNLRLPARSLERFSDRNSYSNYAPGAVPRFAVAGRVSLVLAWAAPHTPSPPYTALQSGPPTSHLAAAPPAPPLREAQRRSPFFGSGRPWTGTGWYS